ncbi:MAG: PAS domain-containing protein [Sulfitobacter sp.]
MDNALHNAQNVVSMSDYLPETGYTALTQVEAYWEALRAGRLVPKRSEVDPRGIENALENAFILERIAPGVARIRVAGSHLNDLMGMEVRGMPLTAFIAPTHRRQVADALEEMFQTPARCTLELSAAGTAAARAPLDARLLLLPLKSDLGDVSRALGCLVSKGDIGSAPRRFDVTAHRYEPLIPGDTHIPQPSPVPAAKAPIHADDRGRGFAAPTTAFSGKATKRPPYLRLVKSDD